MIYSCFSFLIEIVPDEDMPNIVVGSGNDSTNQQFKSNEYSLE